MQETQEMWVWSLGWEDSLEGAWQPTPAFSPGESHGQRSPAGYSHGAAESDTTERLSHDSLEQPNSLFSLQSFLISPHCFPLFCDSVALFKYLCACFTWEMRSSLDLLFLAQCLKYRKTSVCLLLKVLLMSHCHSQAVLQQQYVTQTRAAHNPFWNGWVPTKARYLLWTRKHFTHLFYILDMEPSGDGNCSGDTYSFIQQTLNTCSEPGPVLTEYLQ